MVRFRAAAGVASFLLSACAGGRAAGPLAPDHQPGLVTSLDDYDVIWSTPGKDASSSMPIGNGEVGCNVWVDGEAGELCFYVSRTDAWSEASRLLKLGKVRIRFEPNPFAQGGEFRQRLCLARGCIEVHAESADQIMELRLFVDAERDVIHVTGESAAPLVVTVVGETWRNQARRLQGDELASSWTMQNAPAGVEVIESADRWWDCTPPTWHGPGPAIAWSHRNERSVVQLTGSHQGLGAARTEDPLLDREYGCRIEGPEFTTSGHHLLVARPARTFALHIAAPCVQDTDPQAWPTKAQSLLAEADVGAARARTEAWWGAFWRRSSIFVEGDLPSDLQPLVNPHPLRIGVDSSGGNRFVGEIADLAIDNSGFTGGFSDLRAMQRVYSRARVDLPCVEPGALDMAQADGFTITATVVQDSEHPIGRIVDKMTAGGSDGFLFDTWPGGALRVIVGDRQLVAEHALPAGERHKVAASYDALKGTLALWRDDQMVASSYVTRDFGLRSELTRALVLQRWMQACGGRGEYPIKFNGSIFTVEPKFTAGQPFDADWRRWGDCFWWQNTRLPYHAMLAQGDFDMMEPLFRLYERCLPLARERARLWHGVDGAWFPETMTPFGTYANQDYGWDRTGHAANEVLCPSWRWAWNQGPELLSLMLDRNDYAPDAAFVKDRLLPMADAVLGWFDHHFARDERGILRVAPTQAVETYWHDVVNDMPSVAGLHDVLPRLLALSDAELSGERRQRWQRLRDQLPWIPMREEGGVRMLAPAEHHDRKRSNVETPELYAVWPFRLFGLGLPGLELARAAYERRHDKQTVGWTQDGQFAALLGLVDEAKANLVAKVQNSNPKHRFPAMWGPNFDWLPDQCHGSNLLEMTQLMLLQAVGDKLLVLPCWPRDWDVSFKLHAPKQTVVEVVWRGGRIERLEVTPAARKADIVLPQW